MAEEITSGRRQKLRDSFVAGDDTAHTDEAILELLLNYAIHRGDLQPLAHNLLQEFGDLDGVLAADFETLCRFKGLKSYTSTLLKLAAHLRGVRTVETQQTKEGKKIAQQKLVEYEPGREQKAGPPIQMKRVSRKQFIKPKTELFTNAVLKEAIEILPRLPETGDIDDIRQFLQENLPFNSENTRKRYVPYITNRIFLNGQADRPIRSYARIYAGRQELRDICFYRFCKAEPLMLSVNDDLLLPAIGYGRLDRSRLREYLAKRYPLSKVAAKCAAAIVDALGAAGIARSDREKISFGYREPLIAALAFVIHSEFPEPGMYEIAKLEGSPLIRAMLWNPDRLLPGVYELRNQGLLAKVSEIDSLRQFTTRYTLDELVEVLAREALPA
jgi:DNA repair protein RadC